jgi:peptide/nickel transport system substrate-binding protein
VGVTLAAIALLAVLLSRIGGDPGPIRVPSNSAALLDAAGERIEHTTPLDDRPGASAIGFGSLWVASPDRGQVTRVDLASGTTEDTIAVGGTPAGIAIGDDAVWVADASRGQLHRVDPETGQVTVAFEAGTTPVAVAAGDGDLWVADSIGAQMLRLDPSTGDATSTPLPGQPAGVTFTADGVWATMSPAGIARVDPATGDVTLTVNVGNGPTAVTAAFGSIWTANHLDGTISRLDPETGTELGKVSVGEGPNALAGSGGLLWVANDLGDSIVAIDPDSTTIARTTAIGSTAVSLAAGDEGLWVAAGASATEHRGGTLTVSVSAPPRSLDPAFAEDTLIGQILSITNDTLVTYRKVGGPSGATLVPDLATALPQVTDGGLRYRFTLRSDVRFSTGELLTGGDVRHSIERTVAMNGYAADLFDAIDGVADCHDDPPSCDLSGAIELDGSDVTISLTRPDPDLLFKLAHPFATVVPSTTPTTEVSSVPATGPYVVDPTASDGLELVRNDVFEEWSPAAQPDGFVDRISFRLSDPDASFDDVLAGDADLMIDQPAPVDVETLVTRNPDQAVVAVRPFTFFVGVDAKRPPFDDASVRQAVNLAIDRAHVVDLLGGPRSMQPTCQILPPGLQGYAAFCPYTLDPGSGAWTDPDPDRARDLIADAGVAGTEVTVLAPDPPDIPGAIETMRYVAGLLNDLGFQARFETTGLPRYVALIYRTPPGDASRPHVFFGGWASEYPRATDFIEPQFRCDGGANIAGFCDPALDAAMDDARELEATEPGEAIRGWTSIEHRLVEEAVQAPVANLVSTYAVSARTGNAQVHVQWGVLLSRIWVR